MFELKLMLQKIWNKRQLRKNQERVSSQVKDNNPTTILFTGLLKLFLLTLFGVIILFPFILMISISLMNDIQVKEHFTLIPDFGEGLTYVSKGKEDSGFELHAWKDVVANTYKKAASTGYWSALALTSLNVVISVTLKIFITFFMGYAFSLRNWRGKNIIWFLALALLVLPEVALLSGQYKVILDSKLTLTYFGFLLGVAFPFSASIINTLMYKNAFEAIPGRIKEVSLIDGAGGVKYLFKVAFPMVVPTTLTIVILTSLASWNAYLWPNIISTIGDQKFEVLSVWLFKAGVDPNDPESGANVQQNVKLAAALIAILPMFGVYLLFRKRIMAAISRQGSTIKG
ncbi:ABC transporter permease subunit [Mycoplasma sp. NEAQ87857]|uniref:carbohydrate ABC transporter permease n=1 Tax=Mycoplasma sp. NEAQ87857 TaxID=2683967 RepID=UPI001317028C|nr:carbohydrate ABC transporter permease [Mycoplasma sp. NEAQ87857]QGZ97335.1 ABC transporter permease subunit [Mycoplasma sp. NEAQ87857]